MSVTDDLIDANTARKKLNEMLKEDLNFKNFVAYANSQICKAIKKHKNYARIPKHENTFYNEELYKILKAKNYDIHSDVEYSYTYDFETFPDEKEFFVIYF